MERLLFQGVVGACARAAPESLTTAGSRELAREMLAMDEDAFRTAFKRSAMKRAKRRGLARNAAVVLGNVGTPDDVDVLTKALDDPDPMVAEHAAWALSRIGGRRSSVCAASAFQR